MCIRDRSVYHHARQSQRHARQDAQCAAVHPHLVVAIDKDVGQHEHEQTDKQTVAEVNATQAYPCLLYTSRCV